ncbi:MAG: type II secretion system protein [Deltaproteobacteria bacterium]|nr:type II secretion system protein [Deltaproteobacteria bacterium]
MKLHKNRGYTLIELMIVVALIAIVAAITVPKITEVNERTALSETVDLVQRSIADARTLSMKTRKAVVVELRQNNLWINVLSGTSCDSSIAKRCFDMGESNRANTVNTATLPVSNMCNLRVAAIASDSCTVSADLTGSGVGLCYNGTGQLWIRQGADTMAECTGTAGAAPNPWEKACSPWLGANAAVSSTLSNKFSGADVRFNRGISSCPAGSATPAAAQDVTRRVMVPAGGHPYIKQVSSAND